PWETGFSTHFYILAPRLRGVNPGCQPCLARCGAGAFPAPPRLGVTPRVLRLLEIVSQVTDQSSGRLAVASALSRGGSTVGPVDRRAVRCLAIDRHRVFGRSDPDVAIAGHPRARRDELADDHVFLEAQERIGLSFDRRVGEHPRRLLE